MSAGLGSDRARLAKAGIELALISDAPRMSEEQLRMAAILAVRSGLPAATARRALTEVPAKLLGAKAGRLAEGFDADLAVFADRFLKPGTAGETDVREGHGYVGGEGVNSKGAKFLNYYFWTTCEGKLVLHMIGENPQ